MNQEWLSEEQAQLLKQLKCADPDPVFKGIPDLSSSMLESQYIQTVDPLKENLFYEVDYDAEHAILRDKLFSYRKKSQQIYKVGELLKQYETKFTNLMDDKNKLIDLIQGMKGSTSQLVYKQKRMIDLSMKMKESLDYYNYHDKFKFDYACDISSREMFQDRLQPILSELTDGMQYFQENSTFVHSKKIMNQFQSSRSKILSFVKSFFIKLFSKESQFVKKNAKISPLTQIDSFYPKSKIKFISAFLLIFPQFQKLLKNILLNIKEVSGEDQVKFLEIKQMEIQQFQLTNSNLALIGYLQKNMPQIYNQAILKFFTYYRTNIHQQNIKNIPKNQGKITQIFRQRFILMIYMMSTEYAYLNYCCRANLSQNTQIIRTTIIALTRLYSDELMKIIKDIKNKSPFEMCDVISKVRDDFPIFLENHLAEEYQSYAFGCISQFINQPQQIDYLKVLFDSIAKRLLIEMESMCFNSLPKVTLTNSKTQVQSQLTLIVEYIPKLKYCQSQADKYLIHVLDSLVKSIKQVNSKMQSRFECYIWNLQMFGSVRFALRSVKGNLIRKQLRLDTNNSNNLIQKFKSVQRNQSLLKYAQDIFQVIKTGMPVINELTLDFSKFINEHCMALQSQFVKDILFIYAKNMIQFLHRLGQASMLGLQQLKEVCQPQTVQTLYSLYVLSIQKYAKDAGTLFKQRESYKVSDDSTQTIISLLDQVHERLFDLMDKFYVSTSSHVACTEEFKQIDELKHLYPKTW